MSQQKKILISLPDTLLTEVDALLPMEKINRSEFIREAMRFYIKEKRRIELRKALIRGYLDMGELNLHIAKECIYAEGYDMRCYEENLAESE